jgi:RNA polymerase sigma-70 factor (ECF subfamily)
MADTDLTQESDWIRRTQEGDKEAFGMLVRVHMKRAYFVALGIVGSHDDALDLSQDAFAKAFTNINRFEAGKRFFTWYYRILRNLCLNFIRDRNVRAVPFSMMDEAEREAIPASQPTGHELLEQSERRDLVWSALWKMNAPDRELILARDVLGTSYEELAELMGCPLGTVMSRLYHARKRLREQLEGVMEWQH